MKHHHPAPAPPYLGPAAHTSSGANKPIRRIVLHSTVSPCMGDDPRTKAKEGAAAIAAYFRSPRAGGSAHYVVDPTTEVQVVYDRTIAWHAPPNAHSLGIEMCDMPVRVPGRWLLPNQARMFRRTARLVAELCLAYDVPPRKLTVADLRNGRTGLCGHSDVSKAFGESTHWDPGFFPWARFIRRVKREIEELVR